MQTKDHVLLANWLMREGEERFSRRFLAGVRFGSFFPDRNPITYLRGIGGKQGLHGHNAEITEKAIGATLDRLMSAGVSGRGYWNGVRLGMALHYLADAFTYPHHKYYKGSLSQHMAYEAALHRVFIGYLKESVTPVWQCTLSFSDYLDEMLHLYHQCAGSPQTDCRFITLMCQMAFHGAVTRKEREEEYYENSDYHRSVPAVR